MTEAMAFKLIEATLRDGRHVRIRAIRPDDRDEVVQAFDRLSSESRYALHVPDADVAGAGPGSDAPSARRARARARGGDRRTGRHRHRWPARATTSCLAGERCEFAVTVADSWRGRWPRQQADARTHPGAAREGSSAWRASCWPRTTACSPWPADWASPCRRIRVTRR